MVVMFSRASGPGFAMLSAAGMDPAVRQSGEYPLFNNQDAHSLMNSPESEPAPTGAGFVPSELLSDPPSVFLDFAMEIAAENGLTLGQDGTWRGPCPECDRPKSLIEMRIEFDGVSAFCPRCGPKIVSGMDFPRGIWLDHEPDRSDWGRALQIWHEAGRHRAELPPCRWFSPQSGRGMRIRLLA